ncbi:beta-eliminating lyase-related protein [Streptomyces sp. NPDC050263]|uniref:beta-eliminating lyase-related protein n=1 Tax=Streptomyces sp. NPDC050263 TaxID=3155037 RepID=UPI00343446DC
MSTTLTPTARVFSSDNAAGASPEIVEAVARAAVGQALPYGADDSTASVRRRLADVFEREVDVLPVSTGSAANALSLAALTPPWGSVLCHRDSHVNNDECGAPEFYTAGAKLVPLGAADANIAFCRLPHRIIEALLADGYAFYHDRWEPGVVRFVTSFATTPQDVDGLLADVRRRAARTPAGA